VSLPCGEFFLQIKVLTEVEMLSLFRCNQLRAAEERLKHDDGLVGDRLGGKTRSGLQAPPHLSGKKLHGLAPFGRNRTGHSPSRGGCPSCLPETAERVCFAGISWSLTDVGSVFIPTGAADHLSEDLCSDRDCSLQTETIAFRLALSCP